VPFRHFRLSQHFTVLFAATLVASVSMALGSVRTPVVLAAAGDGISAYISPPFVQGPPSASGATIEDFNSYTNNTNPCASSGFTRGVATFSGDCTVADGELNSPLEGKWGGANTSSATPTVGGTASKWVSARNNPLTITFSTPVRYFGFWWSAGGAGDTVEIYDPSNALLATFNSTTLNGVFVTNAGTVGGTSAGSALPPTAESYPGDFFVTALNGTDYRKGYYFGRPKDHSSLTPTVLPIRDINLNQYSHTYLNIFTSGADTIGKVVFPTRGSFEFDNVSWATAQQTPTDELVFLQGVRGKSVTFRANGGTGSMPAQTSDAATALSTNTFTRTGHTFSGWHTTSSGTGGTSYANGDLYNFSADITLHAQWTVDPPSTVPAAAPPEITTTTSTTSPPQQPSTPTPTIDAPKRVRGGSTITVVARGFTPGESVQMSVGEGGKTRKVIADANGEVRLTVRLTTNEDGERVLAQAIAGSRKVTQEIQVADSPTTLPSTGASTTVLLLVSVMLCLLGTGLVIRRRWDATQAP